MVGNSFEVEQTGRVTERKHKKRQRSVLFALIQASLRGSFADLDLAGVLTVFDEETPLGTVSCHYTAAAPTVSWSKLN